VKNNLNLALKCCQRSKLSKFNSKRIFQCLKLLKKGELVKKLIFLSEKLRKKLKDLIEATRDEPPKWLLTLSEKFNENLHRTVKIVQKDIVGLMVIRLCIEWLLRLKQCEMKNCTRIAFSIREKYKKSSSKWNRFP
jgi:hypothetical protein